MVIIDRRWFIWRDQLAFFANAAELERLCTNLSSNTLLRVRQTRVELTDHPNLIRAELMMTNFIDLTKELDTIYGEMHAKSCRYKINRANKMNERIQLRFNTPECYVDFLQIYNHFTRVRKHTYPISQKYLRTHLDVSDVWVIYADGRPICAHLVVRDNTTRRVHFCYGASHRLSSKEDAKLSGDLNRYLHWQEIQTYKAQGFELYDFGGGGTGSLTEFKLSFGGFQLPEYSYLVAGVLGTAPYQIYKRLLKLRLQLQV